MLSCSQWQIFKFNKNCSREHFSTWFSKLSLFNISKWTVIFGEVLIYTSCTRWVYGTMAKLIKELFLANEREIVITVLSFWLHEELKSKKFLVFQSLFHSVPKYRHQHGDFLFLPYFLYVVILCFIVQKRFCRLVLAGGSGSQALFQKFHCPSGWIGPRVAEVLKMVQPQKLSSVLFRSYTSVDRYTYFFVHSIYPNIVVFICRLVQIGTYAIDSIVSISFGDFPTQSTSAVIPC